MARAGTMAEHLTDRLVKVLAAPKTGAHRIIMDDSVKGFGLRVTKAGSKAFVLRYRRKADGRETTYTIGSFPDWTASAAREQAKRLKREIDGGADPVGEEQSTRGAPTVNDL